MKYFSDWPQKLFYEKQIYLTGQQQIPKLGTLA